MAQDTGTGKHPHKSAEEPYPHTRESQSGGGSKSHSGGQEQKGREHGGGHERKGGESGGGESLKSREYKDGSGETHHHPKTYVEQHKEK